MADSQTTTLTHAEAQDLDAHVKGGSPGSKMPEPIVLDIEHTLVQDDPRVWSNARKIAVLFIISGASMIAGLTSNIQNPANFEIQQELHTNSTDISLSLSLYILMQSSFPVIWSAVSEVKGRKLVYILTLLLFTIASVIVAISKTIGLVIGMRMLQGAGSSAVITIGAATLADIYEPHQRGTMMGVYYSAPLLGPALGPIIGGALTQGLGWRSIFWFLVILGAIFVLTFAFLFRDTHRKERSITYQKALKRMVRDQLFSEAKDEISEKEEDIADKTASKDVEAQQTVIPVLDISDVKLSAADVNPFPPYIEILSRRNNLIAIIPSGLLFAFNFSITYTCARTMALHYNYGALKTGLVLLAYGVGSVAGSILGGRWSDHTLSRLKGREWRMRLTSTKIVMIWFPMSVVGYGWVCQQHVHVAAVCVMLCLNGFFSLWIYASTLAYVVDANVGRSSSAVAANNSFRGLFAFIAAEVAVPIQNGIGDGGLYTLWAGLIALSECMILLVLYKGRNWRETSIEREKREEDAK